jgi:hypothetical protein
VPSVGYRISQGDFRVHFGLGHETRAGVTVRWPDGKHESLGDIQANQWIDVQEGEGVIRNHPYIKH